MNDNYQVCTRCVMDTSDPEITFDDQGVCTHCHNFENITKKNWFPNEEGTFKLEAIIEQIKSEGKRQQYDCILGLSGGVDSSYLAYKASEWGLRPLVIHVDAGWNSELAVANIEAIVKYCDYHLHTHVVDWEEMRELQLSYLRAGVANQDVPQDHVFFASMYHFAIKNKIRYILNGGNIATEGIFPKAWHGSAMDAINLKAIHKTHGNRRLKTYSIIGFYKLYIWYPLIKKMRTVRPLNFMNYNKNDAISELEEVLGWRSYGRKHGESIFTKLFQNYYLPTRFGYDKRRPHLSSLIASGQITRNDAVEALEEPLYNTVELESDIAYFCKKLGITRSEFNEFISAPLRHYSDYSNWDRRYLFLKKAQTAYERLTGRRSNWYS